MMDTCNDYFVHNLSSANTSSTTSSSIKGNSVTDDCSSGVVNDLSSAGSSTLSLSGNTTSRDASNIALSHNPHHQLQHHQQQHHHHLLQHNSHPQHLIAPVAPTITNHHPQQPGKFTPGNGNGATTSYSTSSSSTGAHSVLPSSVVNGTTTATGGTLQATVYPIQQQPKISSSPSPLDNLKASVITGSAYESNTTASYHHHHIQGNYLQTQGESGGNSLWTSGGGTVTRNDHLSVGSGAAAGGYLDNGSAAKVLMANANSGQVNFNANLSSNCVLGNDNLPFNVTSHYGENGLVQGTNSNLGYSTAQHTLYQNVNYATGATGGDGQMVDFSNSSKCTYNSSSPVISNNQTTASPFHHYNPSQHAGYTNINSSGGGSGNVGMQKAITNGGSSYLSNNMNSQMRSGNQSHSYDLSAATGQLEYQAQYQAAPPSAVPPVDGLGQRTYMDLSASKPQTNHSSSSYYTAQVQSAAATAKTKRFGVYEDTASSQYLMPDYSYNGYKGHPSLVHSVPQMPSHAQQIQRGHYSRQSSGPTSGSHQIDPKLYRRSYQIAYKGDNGMKPVHLNYHPQYGYASDPMTGKRLTNYPPHPPLPPPAPHQMNIPNGYSDPIYDLESAKKKAAYSNAVHQGKFHYPYYEDYRMNTKGASQPPPPPPPVSGQYGLVGSNMPIHANARPNFYPNGYINYQHHPHQPPPGYNGGAVGPFYPPVGTQQSGGGGDLYANYMKTHSITGIPKTMDQVDPHSAAMGKYNRNCYYDTNLPPVGEKTYLDLEDQINSSKITKTRNGYPLDYPPHQTFYDPHHPQGHLPYNAKYCQERYLYHPNQQPSHYYPGAAVPGALAHGNTSQSHAGRHMLHTSLPMATKINVREFLSSWNDDEEEAGAVGGGYDEDYQQVFQKGLLDPNTQRIQVGISIDKANVMDSTGTMNLPDIIIDIEKQQKSSIPEIDLTDDAPEETNSARAAEKLYVLESIDVPLSELNKYKHLNVINKLPENVVHLKEGGESIEVGVMEMFNESELIHTAVIPEESKSVKMESGASAVENSLKFIEDIESNSDFKNDFELNVEYESFPNEKSQDSVVSTDPPELPTQADDSSLVNSERKESVIVAVNMKVKSEDMKKRRKLKKALKSLKAQRNSEASKCESENDDDDVFIPKCAFKSLSKCCLEVINTKQFRRNAHKYLTTNLPPAQDDSSVPRHYKYLRRFDSRKTVQIYNPKSLREMCAEIVIDYNLVTIQEADEPWRDGGVPRLRDICEEVLQRNNYIINMDMDYSDVMECSDEVDEVKGQEDNEPMMMVELDDNNNHNGFAMISGLPQDDRRNVETVGEHIQTDDDGQSADIEMAASYEASESVSSAYLFPDDALMNCDYFLAEADGGDQIQFSEEVVPVDPDRFKRKQLTDMLRLKYVHNKKNIHALDSRRMILKKYFYYQKFVEMVKKRVNKRDDRNESFVVALKKRYQKLRKVRLRWWKKSKTIVMEPAVEQLSHPPSQIANRPRAEGPPVTIPPAIAALTPQTITAAAHSDTILKLIREGIADRARKSAIISESSEGGQRCCPGDDRDGSDTEVILVTVEKTKERRDHNSRPSVDSAGEKNQVNRIISIEAVRQAKTKDIKPQVIRKIRAVNDEVKPKMRRESESARECEPKGRRNVEISQSELLPRKQSDPQAEGNQKRKVKPKFDDILLGIDEIYKDVKGKPKTHKALKAFEQIDDMSMGSPSSVKSTSTTTSSSSGSSTSTSSTSTSSSGSSTSKSSKSTVNNRGRSKSLSRSSSSSSSSNRSTARSSINSNRDKTTVLKKYTATKISSASPQKTSKLQEIVRKMANRTGPKVSKRYNSSGPTSSSMHEKLIIKTAVVQLERDGYIDKLGKLYT